MGLIKIDNPILSHQPEGEKYKCLRPVFLGHQILICSRCFGLYSGCFIAFITTYFSFIQISQEFELLLILVLPSIGFADWISTKVYHNKGINLVRTISGFCLGVAMGIIASHILKLDIQIIFIVIPIIFVIIYLFTKSITNKKNTLL